MVVSGCARVNSAAMILIAMCEAAQYVADLGRNPMSALADKWNDIPGRQRTVAIVAIFMTAVSIASIAWRLRPEQPPGNFNQLDELGRVLARETAKAVNGSGRIVVWRLRIADNADSSVDRAAESFTKALRQTPGVTVTATEEDAFNLGDPDRWSKTAMEPEKYFKLLKKHRGADALVLIGGTPQLHKDDYQDLPTPRPKVLAAAFILTPGRQIIERQAVQLVIAYRQQTDPTTPAPTTPAAWFDRSFVVVTADNAGELR